MGAEYRAAGERALNQRSTQVGAESTGVGRPRRPRGKTAMNELDDLRSRIRDLDERILQLVCERITLVDRSGRRLIHIIMRGA